MSRLAVFGGSFNPPGLHHRAIAEELASHFDQVVVVPCGPRPDKPATNDVEAIHRAAMADLTFGGLPRVRVNLFDLEQASFTHYLRGTNEYGERMFSEEYLQFLKNLELPLLRLADHFASRIKVSFGWGTNLTNDLGFPALSLVVKAVEANGQPTVKLSDNLAKATGRAEDVERFKRIFGYQGSPYEACRY